MMRLKNKISNKKAQNTVITVILIILLTLAAIVIFWTVIKKVIEEDSDTDITGLTVSLEIKSAWVNPDDTTDMRVKISRGAGKAKLDSLMFILTDKDGNTYKGEITEPSYILNELETRIYQMGDDSVISFSPEINDFKDIVSVSISFGATTTGGKSVTYSIQDTMNPSSNPENNPGNPNPGGSGPGGSGCTPDKDCNHYYGLGQCGEGLSNGCSYSLNCLDCFAGESCFEGICSDVEGSLELGENVLIVYNENSEDALEIAEYYADARGISHEQICAIKLPTGQFAKAKQLSGARKTIIENCICGLISLESCGIDNINEIAEVSPITHLAIIRGIPPRLTETGWSGDGEKPSLDYYLSLMLYRDFDIFGEYDDNSDLAKPSVFWSTYYGMSPDEVDFQLADASRGYIRNIIPSLDRSLAYGRVEAITKEKTFELIDRTVEAENKGVSGNFLVGLSNYYTPDPLDNPVYTFFRKVSSSLRAECEDYLTGGQWPYETCRTGATYNGEIPGEPGSTIDKAINAGIYLGTEPKNNGHAGFDNFDVILNWRKTGEDCIPLCRDTANPEECRASSKDYFKELNTECVGVADGFLGWQLRSYPVQFYGFWPPGWDEYNAAGHSEKTPPIILEGDAFKDSQFTDDKYLHFGALDSKESPVCLVDNEGYEEEPCPEILAINLMNTIRFSPYLTIEGTENFQIKLRYKNNDRSGRFIVSGRALFEGEGYVQRLWRTMDLEPSDEWAEKEINFVLNEGGEDEGKQLKSLLLYFYSRFGEGAFEDAFELDAIEFIHDGENLLDVDVGSFNLPYIGYTHAGDYAANAIDRLGGIAWWGSSSHFRTTGAAFTDAYKFTGAFYSGRSLGESLLHIGDSAMSGIIYGDPLYRPSGVKIYTDDIVELNDADLGYVFFEDAISNKIYINAFHGQSNLETTNWLLAICHGDDIELCDTENAWTEFKSGKGAVFNLEVAEISEITDGLDLSQEQNILMKLRVWNSGDEGNDLTDYAYFYYKIDTDGDGLPDDWEIQNFGDLSQSAEDDPDADNYNNLEEFRFFLGGRFYSTMKSGTTDPLDSTSRPFPCVLDRHCSPDRYCTESYECGECLNDEHCGEGYCFGHFCKECYEDEHCEFGYCENFQCVECIDNSGCDDPLPICYNGECVECTAEDSSGCPIEEPDCVDNVCVGCADDDYCKENYDAKPHCLNGVCVGCDNDAFCADNFAGLPYCVDYQCVECLTLEDCPEENFCWSDNSCYSPTCTVNPDCEDFDDCSEDICYEGYCQFNKLSEEDCYYCADFSSCTDAGGMNICGGIDINHNGIVERTSGQADYDILSSWFMEECGVFNSFCEYADIDRSKKVSLSDINIINSVLDKSCNCEEECPELPTYNAYWKFDTETGGITPDEAEGHDGALIGDAGIVTDTDRGEVLELSGAGHVEVSGHDFSLHDFSVSAWFKADTFVDFNRAVVSQDNGNGDGNGRTWIYIKGEGSGKTISSFIGGTPIKDTGEIASENQWYYVAVTYDWDTEEIRVYIDGVERGVWVDAMEFADGNIFIGRKKVNDNLWYFDGRIDDVMIYSSALTTEEIEQIYCAQGGTGAICGEIGSLSFWRTIIDFFKGLFGL